jgi:hypothetical protein
MSNINIQKSKDAVLQAYNNGNPLAKTIVEAWTNGTIPFIDITIDIPREIIDTSIQNNSRKCIVEEGVRKQVPGAWGLDVTRESVRFSVGEWRYRYDLPTNALQSLVAFDENRMEDVKPFSFRLSSKKAMLPWKIEERGPNKNPRSPNKPKAEGENTDKKDKKTTRRYRPQTGDRLLESEIKTYNQDAA